MYFTTRNSKLLPFDGQTEIVPFPEVNVVSFEEEKIFAQVIFYLLQLAWVVWN